MKASPDALPQPQPESGKAVLTETPPERWVIYLTGEVARPGILEVAPGSRLYEAVEAAGGLTPMADKVGINLAAKLSDGVHAHIPRVGEKPASDGNLAPAGKEPLSPKGDLSPASSAPIDINHAAAEELEALPGIGPKLARQIVEDRTANGPFRTREDLMRVKGIGQAKLERIKEMIVVRP
jgi:competence protein ComEA